MMMKIMKKMSDFVESLNYESGIECEDLGVKKINDNLYMGYLYCDGNVFNVLMNEEKFEIYDDNEVFVFEKR